jgi:hypothetical protein
VELQHRVVARLAALVLAVLVCAALPAAASAAELQRPESQTEPPRFFHRSAQDVERIAAGAEKVREARRDGALNPTVYTKGIGRWQVSFFRHGDEIVQVHVDDRSGAVLEQWSGHQVAWSMARGYAGAFGRKLNAPYVWIPLCLLFIAPFVDVRRPFRLLHLDLLVLLSFGVSHVFFNRGEIDVSAPLVYPVLAYLLARVLLAAFRPRRASGPLVPHAPLMLLVVGLVFITAFRVGLNVADSNVIDVGYAGVIGADRVADGDQLYGDGFSEDVERGDTYGPVSYLLYVPFEQALSWSGRWDELPAAHGAATGAVLALGTAAKFVTAALAPLFCRRSPFLFGAAFLVVLALAVAPFIPDGGLRELYDRTIGYQAGRPSPFSIWGQVDLGPLQDVTKAAAALLALAAAFVPRRPDLRQTAALGAAILIAVELTATHWFYLYVVWFVPFVLVALFAAHARTLPDSAPEASPEREVVYA